MPSVNKVILVGNLTRDPQARQLPSQSTVVEFGLAMNRKFKGADGEDREEVCFVDCTAFGRQAEVIQKYCAKGRQLYIEGRLRFESWEDKGGHGRRSKLSVVVENFQFLGGRDPLDTVPAADAASARRVSYEGAQYPPRPPKSEPAQPFGSQMEFNEADIPF